MPCTLPPLRAAITASCLLALALLAGCGGGPPPSSAPSPERSPAQKLYQEGQLALRDGNIPEAMERFRAAAAASEKEGNREGLSSSLHAIALIHVERGQWREAIEYMERVLSLDRKALDEAKRARAPEASLRSVEAKIASDLYDLARLDRRLGDPEASLKRLREMLEIDVRLGRERGAAITHNNLGRLLLALDRLDEAETHYKASLALFEQLKDEASAEEVRRNLEFLEAVRRNAAGSPSPAR